MTAEQDGRDALDELYWRAEILQAMYWMRGEGLASEVEPADLARFLVAEPAVIARFMQRLVESSHLEVAAPPEDGSAAADGASRYRLTDLGVTEGGRSFMDEFADLLRRGHGACAPGCWCHDPDHAGEPCPSHP